MNSCSPKPIKRYAVNLLVCDECSWLKIILVSGSNARIERNDENYENYQILQARIRHSTRKCKLDLRRASTKVRKLKIPRKLQNYASPSMKMHKEMQIRLPERNNENDETCANYGNYEHFKVMQAHLRKSTRKCKSISREGPGQNYKITKLCKPVHENQRRNIN